jgi:hypothetical protein
VALVSIRSAVPDFSYILRKPQNRIGRSRCHGVFPRDVRRSPSLTCIVCHSRCRSVFKDWTETKEEVMLTMRSEWIQFSAQGRMLPTSTAKVSVYTLLESPIKAWCIATSLLIGKLGQKVCLRSLWEDGRKGSVKPWPTYGKLRCTIGLFTACTYSAAHPHMLKRKGPELLLDFYS